MKRICSFLGILSAVILWPFLSWAQVGENYNIEIEGRYWKPKLDSAVKIVEDGVGTEFKPVNDLGFDERKDFGEARLQIKFARKHKFNFSVIPLKWDGDKVITQTIEFSGKTFTAGTRVQSKLDLNLFKAGYEYDFLAGNLGFLGGTFDILLADVRMELKAPTLALDEKEDAAVPIPMVGLIGRIYPVRWVNLTARVSGLPLGRYGHVIDAEASLNINPIKFVGISAGYRYFESKAEYDDNTIKFKLDGPFEALKIRF
ncbi:MAG: hypothetical protein OEW45_10920 [Deltaproteobacteria bacterium]|nr:hypothetical protein [Deltaproteobacteria bacterium]